MSKPFDLHLDPAQLQAIGHFAAHWSFFETEVEFTISCLGAAIDRDQTIPFAFNEKLRRWRKLARCYYTAPEILAQCNLIIDDAKKAHDLRAVILHGRMLGDPKRRKRIIAVSLERHRSAEWAVQSYDVPPRKIQKWANEVGRDSVRLIQFNAKQLPGSPRALPCRWP